MRNLILLIQSLRILALRPLFTPSHLLHWPIEGLPTADLPGHRKKLLINHLLLHRLPSSLIVFILILVVNDTQSDSIQYLNFAKKWFIQYSIQYCFTQDSIQNIIQFKINSGDSIQNIIQFNSQGMINTGRIGKVPKNWPKSVQNRQKRGLIIKNGKYRFKNWVIHSFHDKIQFKGLFNIIFSGIFNSKNYSIIFFPRKFNSNIYSKFLIWLDSIR